MTRFLLIRHATCDPVGVSISGRTAGVRLNEEGRRQAERLARHLAPTRIDALYASPLERTRETAEAIAAGRDLEVRTLEGLLEVDFGDWTGRTIRELDEVDDFRRFNAFRTGTRIPGGELALEAQARIVAALVRLRTEHPDATVAIVSHADVLRSAIAHFTGVSRDLAHRLTIEPASVSVLALDDWGAKLVRLNETGAAI